jgi:hypothetical protein
VPPVRLLFVVGTGPCGSTLLERILAAHPEIGWVSELPRRLARIGRALGLPRRSEFYDLLGAQVSPMLVDPCRDLTAADAAPWLERRLREFFEGRARADGRPVFMAKFTGWPRARLLAAVFPQARFVHVVRDGRSVASSLLQVPWWRGYRGVPDWGFGAPDEHERREWKETGYAWAYLAGLEWRRLMAAFEASRAEVGAEHWLDVRYEDLVARPRETTLAVLRFAGLEGWRGLERQLARVRVSAARTEAYRHELRPHDLAVLDALLGPALERWGYAPGPEAPAAMGRRQ